MKTLLLILVLSFSAFGQSNSEPRDLVFGDNKNKVYYGSECIEINSIPSSDMISLYNPKEAESKGFVRAQICTKEKPAPVIRQVERQPETAAPLRVSSLREVETDQSRFVEVPISITGSLNLSNYYNFGYYKRQRTHLAFTLTDDTATAYVYMRRGETAEKVREKLVKALSDKVTLIAKCTFIIPRARYEKTQNIFAELIDCNAPEITTTRTQTKMLASGKPVKVISILAVSSDKANFIDIPVQVKADIEISTQYVGRYHNAQSTHYAFILTDDSSSAFVYMEKNPDSQRLRNALLKAKKGGEDSLPGIFTFIMKWGKSSETDEQIVAELVGFSPTKN